jgi:hypothetical protein
MESGPDEGTFPKMPFEWTAETNLAMIHVLETSGWTRLETEEASLTRRAAL